VKTNIHGGDLHEIDKNDMAQKFVSRTDQKRSKKWLLIVFFSHNIQKVFGFLPKLGRMG
jgi:hypothetical protein